MGRTFALLGVASLLACSGDSALFADAVTGAGGGTTTTTTGGGGSGDGGAAAGGDPSATGGGPGAGGGHAGAGGIAGDCSWGGFACDEGFFCNAPGCGVGQCEPILPPESQLAHLEAVCGCDGVTAYNPTLAASRGVAVKHPGACAAEEHVACDTMMAACPEGLACNVQMPDAASCFLGNTTAGSCWALPPACEMQPRGRACAPPAFCSSVCSMMQTHVAWYEDVSCAFSP
jgi:hypothetical protein